MRKHHKWTKDEIEFLKKYANQFNNKELASKLGLSIVQVTNAIKRYHIKRNSLVSKKMKAPNKWKQEDWVFVVNHFLIMSPKEMSKIIPHSESAIQQKLNKSGLCLPENLRQIRLIKAQFKKGGIPWNKGLKGLRMSPGTEFKPGHISWNTKYDGCITVRDSNRIPYKYIRLDKRKWVPYHRWLWEQTFGPIPPGYIVAFKNGNTLDVRLENLQLMSRAENACRNRNSRKAAETMKEKWRNGSINLSDKFMASLLAPRRPDLKKTLLEHKEILELKRLQIKLKQAIREVKP